MAKKEEFGDIIENHDLVKRTLMVAGFPGLIKSVKKDDCNFFEGFLPGFEFASVSDLESEDECVEYLQDMLDDEVEELVVFGKSLPFVDEDDVLLKKYPDYKIVYLDINVYATKDELNCCDDENCSSCSHNCSSCGSYDDDDCDGDCDCHCDDDFDDDDYDCDDCNHEHSKK